MRSDERGDDLPDGFEVRVRDDVLTADGGGLLVGGAPLRVLRLSAAARRLVTHGRDGGAVLRVADAASRLLARRLLDTNIADPQLPPDVPDPQTTTIVIPVRDRPEQLNRALRAVAGLACIVVDDASQRPAEVAAVAAAHGARLVVLPRNVGPAGARNRGLAEVRTPYVAFVDSDVEADPDTLLRLALHLADPACAAIGPMVRGFPRSARPRWFERYDVEASSLTLGVRACSVRPRAAVAWLPSACLVARTAALRDPAVNGFDEARRVGEDVDLVWRLVDAGWRVRYDPAEQVRHEARGTLRAWLGRKFFYGTGSAHLASTHGDRLAPAELALPTALAAAALLVRPPGYALVAAGGLASTLVRLRGVLPAIPGRSVLVARIGIRGTGWALRQEADLILRHWWPAFALGALLSRHVRRTVCSAVVVDIVVALAVQRPALGPVTLLAGRWADNFAYGAGLWVGAGRARSLRALLPRRVRRVRRAAHTG